jgi:hypothetical protein
MVLVDDAAIMYKSKLRYHMTADSLEELHAFAEEVGIKRCWFHRGSKYPHYDITGIQRDAAIAAGAKAVSDREAMVTVKSLYVPKMVKPK